MAETDPRPVPESSRTPSLFTSLLVAGVMPALIFFSVAFFGADAAKGPLQVSQTLAILLVLFVAHSRAFRYAPISKAARGGVTETLG